MADTKTTDLTAFTPILTDIGYGVDDPGGTPVSGKFTFQALMELFEANIVLTEANISDLGDYASLGANEFTGTQDFNGQQVEGGVNKVVTSVSGTLTAADHSGNVLVTSGNVTIPTTAGFSCILIAGGAHTVTFNGNTSAAMATGDLMTVVVQNSAVIHAALTPAANKVAFT